MAEIDETNDNLTNIALFMGLAKQDRSNDGSKFWLFEDPVSGSYVEALELDYDLSWEYLMTVVEKVEAINGLTVHIIGRSCSVLRSGAARASNHAIIGKIEEKHIREFGEHKLEGVFLAMAKFAKLYNVK